MDVFVFAINIPSSIYFHLLFLVALQLYQETRNRKLVLYEQLSPTKRATFAGDIAEDLWSLLARFEMPYF